MVNFTATTRSVSGRFVASPKRNRGVENHRCDVIADEHNSPSIPKSLKQKRSNIDTSSRSDKSIKFISNITKVPTRLPVTRRHVPLTQTNNVFRTTPTIKQKAVSPVDTSIQNSLSSNTHPGATLNSQAGKEDKRVLRSKYGPTRSRSAQALIQFFPEYEESVFGPPKDPGYLTIDSTLFITNKRENIHDLPIRIGSVPTRIEDDTSPSEDYVPPDGVSTAQPSSSYNAQEATGVEELNFNQEELEAMEIREDPLPDSLYTAPHKKAERHEKLLRNIEKVYAQAEKLNLERLLEGLEGPDWLKTMGISGITDSEKKKYEPKRDYYINAVQELYNKFDWYKEQAKELEEKRREMNTVRLGEDTKGSEQENEESDNEDSRVAGGTRMNESGQSAQEGIQLVKPTVRLRLKVRTSHLSLLSQSSEPAKPFTSFYPKTYLRDAAVGKHRRGRSLTAFGQLIPDTEQQDFALPEDFRSEEAVTMNARKRRRVKWHSEDLQGLPD